MGDAPVLSLCFFKESLTKTDRCAGALSWKRNQHLVQFVGVFILTDSSKRRSMSMNIFSSCCNPCQLYQRIPGNFWSYVMISNTTKNTKYPFCNVRWRTQIYSILLQVSSFSWQIFSSNWTIILAIHFMWSTTYAEVMVSRYKENYFWNFSKEKKKG